MRRIVGICSVFAMALTVQSAFGMQENNQSKYLLEEKGDFPGKVFVKEKGSNKVLCELVCFNAESTKKLNSFITVKAFQFCKGKNGEEEVLITFAFAAGESRISLLFSLPDGKCLTDEMEVEAKEEREAPRVSRNVP